MRKLLFLLAWTACASATLAQTGGSRQGSTWDRVQSLPASTSIRVKTAARHITCAIKTVDAESLGCLRPGQSAVDTFARTEIISIKVPRRGRSTLAGAGIGLGTGALIGGITGAATTSNSGNFTIFSKGQEAGILAILFGVGLALVGLVAGYFTDFTATTLYRR